MKKIISILKYLLFLCIGLGLLWYVTKDQNFISILNDFKNLDYFFIIISMLVGIISHLFRAYRWNLLINTLGHKPSVFPTFFAVMTGYFANLVVPRMGEVTRCGVLSKHQKIPFNSLFGTVIIERLFDMLCLIIILFLVFIFQFSFLSEFLNDYLISPISNSLHNNISSLITYLAISLSIIILLFLLIKKYFYLLKKISSYSKIKELFLGFLEGIKTIKKMKTKNVFIFHTLIIWICYVLMVYFCFFAMNSDAFSSLRFIDGITVMATGSLGIVAPVPGGIGAYHFIVKATMVEVFGLSSDTSTSFAFVVHAAQTIMIVLVGGLSMLLLMFINKKNHVEKP